MDRFNLADLKALAEPREGNLVTIYLSTDRGGSSEYLHRLKLRLDEAEQKLRSAGTIDTAAVFRPARAILENADFWHHASDGLAAFLAPEFQRIYRLPIQFAEKVVVGQSFYVKPLLPWVNDDGRFFILALSQNHTRLLEATAHSIRRVEVTGMPESEAIARRYHDRDETLQFHSQPAAVGRAPQAIYSGRGVGIDDAKDEILHYFQDVDRAVHHSLRDERAPLMLAIVGYEAPIYRTANKYPNLAETVIAGNPDHLSDQELHDRAWPAIAPMFHDKQQAVLDRFRRLAGTGFTTTNIEEILPAVRRGGIETLFVVGDRDLHGRFDPATNRVEILSADKPGAEDLVNLAMTYAVARDRHVHAVPAEKAFDGAALAGVYFAHANRHGN